MTERPSLPNLRLLRQARQMSQFDLSQQSALSQTHISNLERGARPRPSDVDRLAAALGVSARALTGGTLVIEDGDLRLERGR